MTDLATLDLTAQAELVRRGDATPVELVDAAIARVEALQPTLNAMTTTRFERAHDEAVALTEAPTDAPLRGVPFALKDLGCPMAGEPAHEGMQVLKDHGHVATEDSTLVRRFRAAGLVILGRTSTPELGIQPTTEPHAYGPTRNPWDITRTAGGSSGGSAAAVASGMLPAAHASDGGGSIRVPAACCGLVGLKPSRGRIPVAPGSELARVLSVQLAVTRSVRDMALLLDLVGGPELGDAVIAPVPVASFRDALGGDRPLRIGLMTQSPGESTEVHPDNVAATEQAARHLAAAGHHVEVAHPTAFDEHARVPIFLTVWAVQMAASIDTWGEAVGRPLTPDDVEPLTWALAEYGRAVTGAHLMATIAALQSLARRAAAWWGEGWDLLLTPSLGERPFALGHLEDAEDPLRGYARSAPFTPFTPMWNMTGQPAISVPGRPGADGLPSGVHLVAAYGREDLLLRAAATLEAADPWADRRPAVHA